MTGTRFRKWRERREETLEFWADKIGLFPQALSEIELGKRLPTLKQAVKVEVLTRGRFRPRDWVKTWPQTVTQESAEA